MVDVVIISSEYFKFYKNFISYSLTLYYSVYWSLFIALGVFGRKKIRP